MLRALRYRSPSQCTRCQCLDPRPAWVATSSEEPGVLKQWVLVNRWLLMTSKSNGCTFHLKHVMVPSVLFVGVASNWFGLACPHHCYPSAFASLLLLGSRAIWTVSLGPAICSWGVGSGLTQNSELCREYRPGFFLREKGCQDMGSSGGLRWLQCSWTLSLFANWSSNSCLSKLSFLYPCGGRKDMYKLCLWQLVWSNHMPMWKPSVFCSSQVPEGTACALVTWMLKTALLRQIQWEIAVWWPGCSILVGMLHMCIHLS